VQDAAALPPSSVREGTTIAAMPEHWRRGRLLDGGAAPAVGEDVTRLLERPGAVVEQILSGRLESAVDYVQESDEWVALLAGAASLVVAGEPVELTGGDWLFLPAGVEHRLVSTAPGSSWLAVHLSVR
jgi:cupin 2 domain-containing protein